MCTSHAMVLLNTAEAPDTHFCLTCSKYPRHSGHLPLPPRSLYIHLNLSAHLRLAWAAWTTPSPLTSVHAALPAQNDRHCVNHWGKFSQGIRSARETSSGEAPWEQLGVATWLSCGPSNVIGMVTNKASFTSAPSLISWVPPPFFPFLELKCRHGLGTGSQLADEDTSWKTAEC